MTQQKNDNFLEWLLGGLADLLEGLLAAFKGEHPDQDLAGELLEDVPAIPADIKQGSRTFSPGSRTVAPSSSSSSGLAMLTGSPVTPGASGFTVLAPLAKLGWHPDWPQKGKWTASLAVGVAWWNALQEKLESADLGVANQISTAESAIESGKDHLWWWRIHSMKTGVRREVIAKQGATIPATDPSLIAVGWSSDGLGLTIFEPTKLNYISNGRLRKFHVSAQLLVGDEDGNQLVQWSPGMKIRPVLRFYIGKVTRVGGATSAAEDAANAIAGVFGQEGNLHEWSRYTWSRAKIVRWSHEQGFSQGKYSSS